MKSKLTKHQKVFLERTGETKNYGRVLLKVQVRFDDECGNGHNTLSVTGSIYESPLGKSGRKPLIACGCVHEEILELFPELADAIKFHLCSTDGPIHYIENSLYHTSDKDCWGKRKGEPSHYETRARFGEFPMTFEIADGFIKMIEEGFDFSKAEIESFTHSTEPITYKTRYRIKGYEKYLKHVSSDPWFSCTHRVRQDLEALIECLAKYPVQVIKTPIAWSEGKEPDLQAARASAIWPGAELKDFTEEKLTARLPELLKELKCVVESLGMTY